jgi:DNA-binding HxlR family transcriptional regulator
MAKYKKKLDDDIRCPLEYGLMLFGGKWKSRIICVLSANERLRYSEIRKEMYNITDSVLAATLKDLIEAGIIDRKSYDEIPPRVEYSLTEKGRSVVPILQSICQWSDHNRSYDEFNSKKECHKYGEVTHCR